LADQRHRFMAARTGGRRYGRRELQFRSFPIEQGQDALPSGFGGGTEPTEVADALKTLGQDVLEEAAEELGGSEPKNMPLLIAGVFIFKGDLIVMSAEDALRTQRGVVNVSRQILDSSLAAASGLNINDPCLAPDRTWNRVEVGQLLESSFQTIAKASGQKLLWQEELGRGWPAPSATRQSANRPPGPRNARGDGTGVAAPRYAARLKCPVQLQGTLAVWPHPARWRRFGATEPHSLVFDESATSSANLPEQ
jgi:hypothetical protein